MSQSGLKLAGTQQASTVSTVRGYKVEEMSRSGMARAFMAAPRVDADGRIDMREVSDHGKLRLCETINPREIITMGDEIFGPRPRERRPTLRKGHRTVSGPRCR